MARRTPIPRASVWLNPFGRRMGRRRQNERLVDAIRVVGAYRVPLRDERISWFGWALRGDAQERYLAVGCEPDAELGLEQGRGFVVDVVSEHLVWEHEISGARDLPRSVADFVRR
ncbi:MAG: hypothetical protein ACXVY5_01165 [Gaiellales bacterium]